jgi:hypothetical protein
MKMNPISTSGKTNPIKPNFLTPKMNLTFFSAKDYENERLSRRRENKPNQTQFQSHRLYACFNFFLWDVGFTEGQDE